MRLIDADAFKEYITSACEDVKHLFNDGGAVAKLITEGFCKDIDEQPTIQPEPKRGKWNRLDMDTFNCNKCGATFVLNQGGEKMHFCPNCGAKMEVTT